MLADGTITARIRSTVELDGAGQILDKAPPAAASAARPSSASDRLARITRTCDAD